MNKAKTTYRDFLHADYGHSFAEWLGIDQPTYEYRIVRGEYEYQMHSRRARGEWSATKKAAKASYKAVLKHNKTSEQRDDAARSTEQP